MEVALYHPAGGYYTSPEARPNPGDYYTSPMAHPAFGAALAVQLRAMWRKLGTPAPFTVVEMGAGAGTLAADVTAYAGRLDGRFASALDYVPVEVGEDAPTLITGCVLSNELVDAMPVARFQVVDGEPREIFVTLDPGAAADGRLTEQLGEPVTGAIAARLATLGHQLPDGLRGEVNPGIGCWVEGVSKTLARGFVVTIDYGGTAKEIYARSKGTLQTYFSHVDGLSPYQNVGRQDITAHVDFSAVEAEGAKVGLRSLGLVRQAELLGRNGIELMAEALRGMGLPASELRANRYGVDKLTRPEGLGGFRALVQERGTGVDAIEDVWPSNEELEGLPAPAPLGPGHIRLAEGGGYPSLSLELESLWPEDWDSPVDPPGDSSE